MYAAVCVIVLDAYRVNFHFGSFGIRGHVIKVTPLRRASSECLLDVSQDVIEYQASIYLCPGHGRRDRMVSRAQKPSFGICCWGEIDLTTDIDSRMAAAHL